MIGSWLLIDPGSGMATAFGSALAPARYGKRRSVVTGGGVDTSAPGVLAAGEARSGSRPRITAAVEDGAAAASRAQALLASLNPPPEMRG